MAPPEPQPVPQIDIAGNAVPKPEPGLRSTNLYNIPAAGVPDPHRKMMTTSLLLSDSSQITVLSPHPILAGTTHISHGHAPSKTQYSNWTVSLTTAHPQPPSSTSDTLTITTAANADAKPPHDPVFTLYATLHWYFSLPAPTPPLNPGQTREEWTVTISRTGVFSSDDALAAAEQAGLLTLWNTPAGLVSRCLQRQFWQTSYPFLKLPSPCIYTVTNGVRHPLRPRPARRIYRRYIPSVGAVLSFRLASLQDAPTVNRWMNNPRVSKFWGEEGDLAHTQRFLQRGLEMRHSFPVIGSWEEVRTVDGKLVESGKEEAFGYFEVYWVKEDRLGEYCNGANWERGLHVLVGEERFRGEHRVRAWLGSLVHYCWLDDPRTMTVTLEPRADNDKFVGYLIREGFYKEKYVNFPHKRAALMRLSREAWCGPAA